MTKMLKHFILFTENHWRVLLIFTIQSAMMFIADVTSSIVLAWWTHATSMIVLGIFYYGSFKWKSLAQMQSADLDMITKSLNKLVVDIRHGTIKKESEGVSVEIKKSNPEIGP